MHLPTSRFSKKPGYRSHHLKGLVLMHFVTIDVPLELLADGGKVFAGDPDLQFCLQIKGTVSFQRES